jgi:hypothetical protein
MGAELVKPVYVGIDEETLFDRREEDGWDLFAISNPISAEDELTMQERGIEPILLDGLYPLEPQRDDELKKITDEEAVGLALDAGFSLIRIIDQQTCRWLVVKPLPSYIEEIDLIQDE